MTAERLYLDREAAAQACSVSVSTIDQAIRAGELHARKRRGPHGGRNTKILLTPDDLRAWVETWDVA